MFNFKWNSAIFGALLGIILTLSGVGLTTPKTGIKFLFAVVTITAIHFMFPQYDENKGK